MSGSKPDLIPEQAFYELAVFFDFQKQDSTPASGSQICMPNMFSGSVTRETCAQWKSQVENSLMQPTPKLSAWKTAAISPEHVFSIDVEAASWDLPVTICVANYQGKVILNFRIDYGGIDLSHHQVVKNNRIAQFLVFFHFAEWSAPEHANNIRNRQPLITPH
jgi:hypothetical protein